MRNSLLITCLAASMMPVFGMSNANAQVVVIYKVIKYVGGAAVLLYSTSNAAQAEKKAGLHPDAVVVRKEVSKEKLKDEPLPIDAGDPE